MKPEWLDTTSIAIMVDLSRPWNIMNELEEWREVILDLFSKVPPSQHESRKKKLRKYFAKYEVPEVDEEGNIVEKDNLDDLQEEPKEKGGSDSDEEE